MDLERRVTTLEKNFTALLNKLNREKAYMQADINALRICISDITPYTQTKTAYIGDTEVSFCIPKGNLSIFVKDSEGNFPTYTVEKTETGIKVVFEPLEYVTEVAISVIKEGN